MGALDPLGMPLATEVVSGERAEEGGDLPSIERMRNGLQTPGLLLVGDCKRSALDTRAALARHQDWSLSPLPLTGTTADAMDAWSPTGVTQGEPGALVRRARTTDRGHTALVAEGAEVERTCRAPDGAAGGRARVVVGRSPMQAEPQAAGLEKRLGHAETPLRALTPPRGRGKRHRTDEAPLVAALAGVLTAYRGAGLLRVTWAQQGEHTTHSVGRGRGAVHRAKRVIQKIRSHSTHIARQEDILAARRQRCGWKAFVTNAEPPRLSLQDAVLCSRHDDRIARSFTRLTRRVHIAPLFVTRNAQIEGLTYLLTLGGRV